MSRGHSAYGFKPSPRNTTERTDSSCIRLENFSSPRPGNRARVPIRRGLLADG